MSTDIGAVGVAGDSSFDAATSAYHITGAGTGPAGTADAFHFAYYQVVRGDGQMIVRLASTDALAQSALVMRESLDASAASAAVLVNNGVARFVRRLATGHNTVVGGPASVGVPCWLKLVRGGSTITALISTDGQTWAGLGSDTIPLGTASIYAGLAVSNGVANATGTATASFDNIQSTFLPSDGLLLWLKADVGVTQDANGAVSLWADQSGGTHDAFQATASNRPSLVTSAIGDQSAIYFDGSNGYLQLSAGFSDFTQGLTALVITRPTGTAAWQRIFDIGNGPASDNLLLARNGGSNDLIYDTFLGGGLGTTVNGSGVLALNSVQLLEVVHGTAAGTVTMYKNGLQIAQGGGSSINNVVRSSGFIGKSNWGDPLFQGDIAEIVLFDHPLPDTERQTWEHYLNLKYGYDPVPTAPSPVRVLPFSSTQMLLSWTESAGDVSGYTIERQIGSGAWSVVATLATASTGYTDSGLTPNTAYSYRVTAINSAGSSPVSDVATATTPASGSGTGTLPVSGLQLWLRADAGVTNDANGAVSTWTDQLGGVIASQGTAGCQPTLISGDVNGLPALRFDGGSSYLDTNFTGMGGQEMTLFVVTKGTQYQSLLRFQPPGSGNYLVYPWSSNQAFINSADGGTGAGLPCGLANGQWNIGEVAYKAGTQVATYHNGTLVASRTAGNAALPGGLPLDIGRYQGGSEYAQADIAEVLIYNRALNDADRSAVETYLNGKYAVVAPPVAPSQVTATTVSSARLALSWTESSSDVTGYTVERQNADGTWSVVATLAGNITTYVDNGLAPSTAYQYRVTANNLLGSSPVSVAFSGTTPAASSNPALPMTGLRLWLGADAGVIQDANGAVRLWADQSGNNRDAIQNSAANQPHLVTSALNSAPILRFDGGNSFLSLPSDLMNGATSGEVFIVLRSANGINGSTHGLWNFNDASVAYYVYGGDNSLYETFGTQKRYGPIIPPVPLDQGNLYDVSAAPGAWTMRFNGAVLTNSTNNTTGFSAANYTLGQNRDGYRYAGDIAEMLIFDRVLSESERQTLETYLNGKYAFAAPPSAPVGLSAATISSTQISLLWTFSPAADGYLVERKDVTVGGDFQEVAAIPGGTVQAFLDGGLTTTNTYTYRVRAYGLAGDSPYSSEASVTLSAAGGPNVPTDDLLTWLRADAGVVQSATHAVSNWTDLSGHGNDASQSAPSNQPQFVATAINNEPVVRFDGGSSFLNFPSDLMNGLNSGEALIVLRSNGAAGSAQGLWNLNDSDGELFPWLDGSLYETFGSQVRYGPIYTTVPLNQCNLYEISAASGAWTMRLDGNLVASNGGNMPDFAGNTFLLGRNAYGNYFAGDVAEMLLFSHALSDGDRQFWEHYLNAKYHFNPPPVTPTGLQVTALSASQEVLNWTESTPGAFTYTIERQNGDGTWSVVGTVSGSATSYVDAGLTPGVSYHYRVTASNDIATSSVSDVAAGTIDPAMFGNDVFPVTGLRVWLRSDVGVVPDANGGVTSWADQSGGDRKATQGTSSIRPKLVPSVVNGQAVVRFDGAGSYLNLADHQMSGVTAGEAFVVVRAADPLTGSNRGLWFNNETGGFGSFYPATDGTLYEVFGTNTRYGPMSSPAPLDQFNLYNVAASTGEWTARMNAQVLATTQTNTAAFSDHTFLLGISSEGVSFAGDLAELLIFDHILTESERTAVQKYCTVRYALNGFLEGDANADADGDGLTNYQEFMAGSDPLDYYNGLTPVVAIVGGNNQLGTPGVLVAQPLKVKVTSSTGVPLVNAPVVFTITRSTGLVADPTAPSNVLPSVTVRTGTDGVALALFQSPAGGSTLTSLVTATAGYANRVSVTTFAEAIVANDDTSGDGLPDGWKLQHGLDLTINEASGDPDGDGLTNLQEYYLGTDPNAPDFTPDGVSVGWMVSHGLDPRYDSTSAIDPNGVGLTYAQEYQLEQSTVDLWKFDEGNQSVTTTSSSGHKDTGVLVNNPTWILDPDGGTALSFNQLGAQVDIGTAADGHLDFGATQSFSLAARFQTTVAGTARLVGKGAEATSSAAGYFLGISDGHLSAGMGSGDAQSASLSFQTGAAFNDGQWHHVAATFDRSTQQACVYVDGILQPVVVAAGSAGVSQGTSVDFSAADGLVASRADAILTVGALNLAGTASFTGNLDNVGLFTKALTAAEVQALAGKQNNLPPVVAIDSPLPAAEFPELGDIAIDAQASSSKTTINKVEFFNGLTKVGEAHSYPYAMAWMQVSVGTYAITAKATDSRGASSTSAPVSITVSADSDQDGLPDDWEMRYFGNLNQNASGSYLNDGISNLTKYLLGLDPTKPVTNDTTQATGLVVFTPLQ